MSAHHYWGYRISNEYAGILFDELKQGRLRQGWGYDENQDLRNGNAITDDGVKRNLPILNYVKKGDYLLIPHMPDYDSITIAQATNDFSIGYEFEILQEKGVKDFGHIFPAKFIKRFSKRNINVGANIKSTMKCVSRFWNIDRCAREVEMLLNICDTELVETNTIEDWWNGAVETGIDEQVFAKRIYEYLHDRSNASEWEEVLRIGFEYILPECISVEKTWNVEEKKHGSDLLIKIPGIFETTYVIAIQIKDYKGVVSDEPVKQINMADDYYSDNPGEKLIDKYLIITDTDISDNEKLASIAKVNGVKIIFRKELEMLLARMAKNLIGYCARMTAK